jgi:hypothetical protein
MRAAGEQFQAEGGLLHHLGLGQDAAADGDHGIGGEHQRIGADAGLARLLLRRQRLEVGEANGELARQFALLRRLVDMRRHQVLGLDADLVEQREAAGRGGSQNQLRTAGHDVFSS